ncbi:MAG: PAS domain S-box protein, partial [Alphaproteobacteria bacterium]
MADTNLNALLQSMLEGMILQDNEGKIIQFNQAALDILGVSRDQLTTENLAEPEGQDKIFPGKNHVGMMSLKTGETQKNIVLNIIRADGEMRWISLNAVPIFDKETSTPYQLVNTFIDITEVKRVSNDLKQAEFLFNISHDLIIITNQQGYFKKINPRFSEVL